MRKRKCPYCQLGAEMSSNYVSGHIEINKIKDAYYLVACSSQDMFSNQVEFHSVAIKYCPVCGRRLTDE